MRRTRPRRLRHLGLSETASMACAQRPSDPIRPAHRVGSLLPGLDLRLLDLDPDGVGTIALRGAQDCDWLITGDLGRLHGDDVHTTRESMRLVRLPLYYNMADSQVCAVVDHAADFFAGQP